MRVSLNWLNDYVDITGIPAEAIAEALTNAGLEVEAVERVGVAFHGVVVGKIVTVEAHPNADKLRLVTAHLGALGAAKVVCGAPNVAEGQLIAFAQLGARVISRKEGTPFTLGAATIRGVESCGMICSVGELGLEAQYPPTEDGIWVLNDLLPESSLGQPLEQALGLEADTVLETAPTANRGDWMSMVGVAREVAALFQRPLTLPDIKPYEAKTPSQTLTVDLQDADVCRYYGGLVMDGLKIGPAPDWMARRLEAAGMRSISNVVDITNYVMLELGQPLHAFDRDKLGNAGTIGVRRAMPGETLVTLDGVERPLSEASVLITMENQPVALAGVMGGQQTEINDTTGTLFLESAFFPSQSTRRSARSVGLRTEASARFERGVDALTTRHTLFRAAALFEKYAGAKFVTLIESPPLVDPKPVIELRLTRLARILGMGLEVKTVTSILEKLGFTVSGKGDGLSVQVPSYRQHDVTREIDLIEEVIRIHGYDQVPYTLPGKTGTAAPSRRQHGLARLHQHLCGAGLQEVVTTSLIGEALLEKTGFPLDAATAVRVTNGHSEEHALLRQSLFPTLLSVAQFNQAQGEEDVWLFELGRVYHKRGKSGPKQTAVSEKLMAAGLMLGNPRQGVWHGQTETDFYTAKGVVESLLNSFSLGVCFEASDEVSYLHPGRSARVLLTHSTQEILRSAQDDRKVIGEVGQLHPLLQKKLKFRQPVFLFSLDADALIKTILKNTPQAKPVLLSAFPAVSRDMAFVVPQTISHQQILDTLAGTQEPLLRRIELFDQYIGEPIAAGQRSLAYRVTLQSDEHTLTDAEIDAAVEGLRSKLASSLGVVFR